MRTARGGPVDSVDSASSKKGIISLAEAFLGDVGNEKTDTASNSSPFNGNSEGETRKNLLVECMRNVVFTFQIYCFTFHQT
jgi:hypothetical protein